MTSGYPAYSTSSPSKGKMTYKDACHTLQDPQLLGRELMEKVLLLLKARGNATGAKELPLALREEGTELPEPAPFFLQVFSCFWSLHRPEVQRS